MGEEEVIAAQFFRKFSTFHENFVNLTSFLKFDITSNLLSGFS